MKQQNVYTEVHIDTLTPEQRKNIIQSRWVLYTQQRNRGASTHRSKRVYRTRHRHWQHLRKHTNLQHTQTTFNTEFEQQLDSTNRRHFGSLPTRSSSNGWSLHASTNRVLQQRRRNRLEAQQSNLRPKKLTKSLANTSSRRATAAWPTAINSRTQHLLHAAAQRLHPGLRGRSSTSWRRGSDQQDLCGDPTNISGPTKAQTSPIRYIKGTIHYKQVIRPTVKLTQTTAQTSPDISIYVDSDWAGCPTTRRSTTGYSITYLGATVSYGSRTQATIALSSAEAELYAINTGTTEALHFQNLLTDLLNNSKANIKIHTDSSSGKSIATRIGTGKKTKHVELKHLFIQQLVALNHLRIIKIHTNDNPADIFTKYVSAETLQRHLHSVGLHVQHYPHSSFWWSNTHCFTNCFSKQQMHPAHTLHTSRGRVEPWDTSTRSISTTSFLCQRLWISNMPDQHVDFRGFWQHDVLDNMNFSTLNSTCFALILFQQFNILLNNSEVSSEDVNMRADNSERFRLPAAICFNEQSTLRAFNNRVQREQHDGTQQGHHQEANTTGRTRHDLDRPWARSPTVVFCATWQCWQQESWSTYSDVSWGKPTGVVADDNNRVVQRPGWPARFGPNNSRISQHAFLRQGPDGRHPINKWFLSVLPLEWTTSLLSTIERPQTGNVRSWNKETTTSSWFRKCGHFQQRICLAPTTSSRREVNKFVNMGAQQAGRLQREAHPGQHQFHTGYPQQVFMGEWLSVGLQHSTEANRDLDTRRQQNALSSTLPTVCRRWRFGKTANRDNKTYLHSVCTQWCNNNSRQISSTLAQRQQKGWGATHQSGAGSPSTMINTMVTMSRTPMTTVTNTNNKEMNNLNGRRWKTTRATLVDHHADNVWSLNKMRLIRLINKKLINVHGKSMNEWFPTGSATECGRTTLYNKQASSVQHLYRFFHQLHAVNKHVPEGAC